MSSHDDAQETATADQDGELDPREAVALLEQTGRRAQREFDIRPPLLMLMGAVVVLLAYGAVWWSVRGQHPYSGPSGAALAVLYTTLTVWVVLVACVFRRATRGVGGRSSRQQGVAGAAFATIWAAVYVFQGALLHAGASHAIVYGIYPAAAPLIIVGSAAAAYETAQENWRMLGFAIAVVGLAAVGAYAGPAGVWGVVGIGLSVLLLGSAADEVRLRHARLRHA